MDALDIIHKYYPKESERYRYYIVHVRAVARVAAMVVKHNPQLKADAGLVEEMALLHDIGIFLTSAPEIGCNGELPYITHGYLGRELLEKESLWEIAPVCERHVGVGLSRDDIIRNRLPLPQRDMMPVSAEEKIVCYADKFFSKSSKHPGLPKSIEKIHKGLLRYGEVKSARFNDMVKAFGVDYIYSEFDANC